MRAAAKEQATVTEKRKMQAVLACFEQQRAALVEAAQLPIRDVDLYG